MLPLIPFREWGQFSVGSSLSASGFASFQDRPDRRQTVRKIVRVLRVKISAKNWHCPSKWRKS